MAWIWGIGVAPFVRILDWLQERWNMGNGKNKSYPVIAKIAGLLIDRGVPKDRVGKTIKDYLDYSERYTRNNPNVDAETRTHDLSHWLDARIREETDAG